MQKNKPEIKKNIDSLYKTLFDKLEEMSLYASRIEDIAYSGDITKYKAELKANASLLNDAFIGLLQ